MRKNIKRHFIWIISIILIVSLSLPVFAAEGNGNIPNERRQPLLVDNANLLSEDDKATLERKLEGISESRKCDVAIVTINSLEGKSAREYADDFYDYNGYGYGSGDDGVLLLLSMENRDWAITTYGFGIKAFTDYGQKEMMNKVLSYLGDNEYMEGFDEFANISDNYLSKARDGKPFDKKVDLPIFLMTLIAIVVGIVVAFIITGTMKAKLKSVSWQRAANNYIKEGSERITDSYDNFLYRNVAIARRPKESSGGSSVHRSSSGRSHGGSSGHF